MFSLLDGTATVDDDRGISQTKELSPGLPARFLQDGRHYDPLYCCVRSFNGRRKEHAIVHFTDQHSCGTGGCTTLILEPAGSSFKVITSIAIGWPPIRILTTKTNGWHDIGIWVQGGGIRDGYEADLPFDGKTYPRNPSVPPARRLVEKVVGRIVIPKDAVGVTLY